MAEAKWSGVLSTTEPRNDVGIIKVRQGNVNSEIVEFQIVQNNKPYDLTGLTVYFCASFGLNLVEKPAVVVNTTGGKIQYTFDDDSMQSVGRQKGYFSIKKAESKIDSTQEFEFQVESSLMTRSIDGKSYIYKLSTLIKVLDDFIKNGQSNFNTWFESVKEILYGVDPGGNVLRELIEARRNSSGNIFASLKARLDKNEDDTTAQFAQTKAQLQQTINPEIFEGTDAEKIQKSINIALTTFKSIFIAKEYDLKDETLIIDKNYLPRKPLIFLGGGTISKSEPGFMFSSNKQVNTGIYFDNISFIGDVEKTVRVFDCQKMTDKPKLIAVHTTNCYFERLDSVYYSPDSYVQTCSSKGDTYIDIETAVYDIAGAFVLNVTHMIAESLNGSFIKHRINDTYLKLEQVSVTDSTTEKFYASPVFDLQDSRGLNLENLYMEKNKFGDIVFSEGSVLENVFIKNVGHYASASEMIERSIVKWGGKLVNCKSINNYTSNQTIAINDTRNVRIGTLQSDISSTEYNLTPDNDNTVNLSNTYQRSNLIVDKKGAPGNSYLYSGNKKSGFFGLVKSEEMGHFENGEEFNGVNLATALSFDKGLNQNSYSPIAKYCYNGKILYVPLHSYKRSLSYDDIHTNATNKKIKIGNHNYLIRLMQGVTNDTPKNPNSSNAAIIGKGNEYNDLILPMMDQADKINWRYNEMARNSDDLRIISWGLGFTNEDLKKTTAYNGSYVWVEGISSFYSNKRMVRGYFSVEYATGLDSNHEGIQCGWQPVLELID